MKLYAFRKLLKSQNKKILGIQELMATQQRSGTAGTNPGGTLFSYRVAAFSEEVKLRSFKSWGFMGLIQ